MATLTYAYAESTAVVGPLAPYVEPHTYDLCAAHADGLTAPRGWAVLRIEQDDVAVAQQRDDDLEALADAVREAARSPHQLAHGVGPDHRSGVAAAQGVGRRGHLRALPSPAPS